jgi:SAM-dependent methyltransferase
MNNSKTQILGSYGKLCTQFYDLDKPSAPPEALAFFLEYAQAANGAVLEAMCGSGRFLIPLMEAGIDIDGLDASSEMLEACRQKTAGKKLQPRLYQQFLHELKLERQYKLVLIPAGSFGLITNPHQVRESLKRLFAVLEPGGKLVLSVDLISQTKSEFSGSWGGRWLKRPDGALMVLSWLPTFDAQTQISKSLLRYEVFQNNRLLETELEEFDLRSYQKGELEQLLTETGFAHIRSLKLDGQLQSEDSDTEIAIECTRH